MFNLRPPGQKPLIGTPIDWSHPLSQGLVGAWLMNEQSGIIFNAINSKPADTSFNVNWIPGGLQGNGSDGYVYLGAPGEFSFGSDPFTFIQWIFGSDEVAVFSMSSRSSSGGQGYEFLIGDGSVPGAWTMRVTGAGGSRTAAAKTGLNDRKWHQVVGAVTQSAIAFSVDGHLHSFLGASVGNITNSQPLALFRRGTNYAALKTRFVSVYGRILNPQEIMDLYIDPYQMWPDYALWMVGGEVIGWTHKWNTIAAANMAKINTIPKANIAKINTV